MSFYTPDGGVPDISAMRDGDAWFDSTTGKLMVRVGGVAKTLAKVEDDVKPNWASDTQGSSNGSGQIWYRTDTQQLRANVNGSAVTLYPPTVAATSWSVNPASFNITATAYADITGAGVTLPSAGVYRFEYWFTVSAIGTPTPTIAFGMNGPTLTSIWGCATWYLNTGGTSTGIVFLQPFDSYNMAQTVRAPATTYRIQMTGVGTVSAGGVLIPRAMRGATAGATLSPMVGIVQKIG